MILQISYDLHNAGRDYASIISTIKSADGWAHPQGSVWLIDTPLSPKNWVDKLKLAGDSDDEYFVVQLVQNAAWNNMDQEAVDWLNSRNW